MPKVEAPARARCGLDGLLAAELPPLRPARSKMSSKTARRIGTRSGGRLGLPEDVLGAVLQFGDLRARFACVCSTRELKEGHARLSPEHERKLILRRFPLLAAAVQGSATTRSPRELFLSQAQLFDALRGRRDIPPPTWGQDAYTFCLELEMTEPTTEDESVTRQEVFFSIYAGTSSRGFETLEFEIPEGVWERFHPLAVSPTEYIAGRGRLMVIRRNGSFLERAPLYDGTIEAFDDQDNSFEFDLTPWPSKEDAAIEWVREVNRNLDLACEPDLLVRWHADSLDDANDGGSTLAATFRWFHGSGQRDFDDMDSDEILQLLQHYVAWSRL